MTASIAATMTERPRRIVRMQSSRGFVERISVAQSAAPKSAQYASLLRPTPSLLRHPRLHRILHVLDLLELDVLQRAADLLDLAEVDGLNHVARLRVDRHRPARAFPFEALGGLDQRVAVALATGLLQRLVNDVHAVIAAGGEEIGVALVLGVERRDVVLVDLRVVIVVVV